MRHDMKGRTESTLEDGWNQCIRVERMGSAVDEIVGAFESVAETEAWRRPQELRKLAAASRRLWVLASRAERQQDV